MRPLRKHWPVGLFCTRPIGPVLIGWQKYQGYGNIKGKFCANIDVTVCTALMSEIFSESTVIIFVGDEAGLEQPVINWSGIFKELLNFKQ